MTIPLHVFCDFDGTIASSDIGDGLFDRFGQREPWHSRLMSGELPITEYWLTMARELRESITPASLDAFLATVPIDPGAHDLIAFARERSIPLTIVSDGFDLYINRFLAMHGLEGLDVYCNAADLTAEGGLAMSFPNAAEGCECFSAGCKRNALLLSAIPEARIVYIGDGASDFCPAEHADIIFAKGRLAAYCNEHRLPHYPFRTFVDVTRHLRLLLERKRIKPRHQAAMKRKRAWEGE